MSKKHDVTLVHYPVWMYYRDWHAHPEKHAVTANIQVRTRFAVLTAGRTGSHFMMYALSNHPQVYMPRQGPAHIVKLLHVPDKFCGYAEYLDSCWHRMGYRASGALFYGKQWSAELGGHLEQREAKLIVLLRRNILRSAFSRVARQCRQSSYHVFKQLKPVQVPADRAHRGCRKRLERFKSRYRRIREQAAACQVPQLVLYTEDIATLTNTGYIAKPAHKRICDFLNIESQHPLYTRMRAQNPQPLSELIQDYDEFKAMCDDEMLHYVEMDEERYA